MSTTMRRPEAAPSADRTLRIPAMRADLLPPEISAKRRVRRTRRIVLVALVVFVALLGLWYAQASYQTAAARSDLNAAQDDAQRLTRQQRAFSEVVAIQAESQAIRKQLASLLGNDLQWARLLAAVQKAAPRGVQLDGISAALESGAAAGGAAPSSGGAASGSQLPNASGAKTIGTVTITGSSPTKAAVAAYVDALGKVPGLETALLNDATEQAGSVQFNVRVNITGAALGGRYTPKRGKAGGT